jgi:hypothetical protein
MKIGYILNLMGEMRLNALSWHWIHEHPLNQASRQRTFYFFLVLAWMAVVVPAKTDAAPVYPLKVSQNQRTLVDQNGQPFLLHGDAPWSLIVQLTREDADIYLTDRAAKGFNTLMVNLIEHQFCDNPPANAYGQEPFLLPGDYSTPNEQYFAHADWVIQRAGELGMQLLLTPSYLGYQGGNEGWYQEMVANGATKLRSYGRYVGTRYNSFDNLIWLQGGDYDPPNQDLVRAIAEGIIEVDQRHLNTAHCGPETSAAAYWGSESWLALDTTYTYDVTYEGCQTEYERTPTRPNFLIESFYENEHGMDGGRVRHQAYWANLSGTTGQIMGNLPMWRFDVGWQSALNSVGATSMAKLKVFFESRPWFDLVPDFTHQVIVDGIGTIGGDDALTCAVLSDQSGLMAFMPSSRTITVDLLRISGTQSRGFWYKPVDGSVTSFGPLDNTQQVQLDPPGPGDWALVIDDTSKNRPAPGTVDSTPPAPPQGLTVVGAN